MAFEIPDWGGSDAFSYRLENKELECGTTAGKKLNKLKTKNKKPSGGDAGSEIHNHTSGKRKLIDSENSQPISKKKRKKHTGKKDDLENGNQEKGKKKANQQNSNINQQTTEIGKKKAKQQNSNINQKVTEKGKKKANQQTLNINQKVTEKGKKKANQQTLNINQQTTEKGKKKAKQQKSRNNKQIIEEGNRKVNQQNSSQSQNDTEKENHKVDHENSCENQNTTDTLQATSPLAPKPTKVRKGGKKKARSKNKYRELYLKQTGQTEKTDAMENKSLNGMQEEINDEKKEGEVETEGKKKRIRKKKKKKPGHLNETENDNGGISSKPKQALVLSKSNEGGGAGDQADGSKVERKKKKRRRKKKKGNPLNESKPEEMKENLSKPEEMGKIESKPQEVKDRAPKRKAAEGEEEMEDSGRMDVRKKLKKNDTSNLIRENNEQDLSKNPRNNKKPSQEKKKAKGKHENAKTKEASINETQKTKKGKKNKSENTKTKEATPNETQKTKKGKKSKSENTKTKEATPNETQKTKKGKKKRSENAMTNEASPNKKQNTKKGKKKNSVNKKETAESEDLEEMTFSDDERECDEALMSEVNAFVEDLDFSRTDRPEEEEDDDEEEEDDDEEEEEEDEEDDGEEESTGSVDTDQEDNNDNNMDREVKNSKSKVTVQEGIDMDSKNISPKPRKENAKFDRLKLMKFLEAAKSPITQPVSSVDGLRMKMEKRLAAAKFRIINEQLYTSTSQEAYDHFNSDPEEFQKYHQGYKDQVKLWPLNPLDVIVKWLTKKPKEWVVADMGCGEAELSLQVPQTKVHSFDLVASNPRVTACDMADTPLPSGSVDAAIFCLSLMGTNIDEFIVEANRILKDGGIMKIAEVESRFENYNAFIKRLTKYGFQVNGKVLSQQYFHVFDLKKTQAIKKKSSLPELHLKPCLYKKR